MADILIKFACDCINDMNKNCIKMRRRGKNMKIPRIIYVLIIMLLILNACSNNSSVDVEDEKVPEGFTSSNHQISQY